MSEVKRKAPVRKSVKKAMPMAPISSSLSSGSCSACSSLPVGSIELTALMLVLVFSLSAVLFTSVFALQTKNVEIKTLQNQVSTDQAALQVTQ